MDLNRPANLVILYRELAAYFATPAIPTSRILDNSAGRFGKTAAVYRYYVTLYLYESLGLCIKEIESVTGMSTGVVYYAILKWAAKMRASEKMNEVYKAFTGYADAKVEEMRNKEEA